ncbi:MAG: outer membrane beta-barrel protein [Bacteroidia bacterium]|nr:outer membrane beta-barrel protein [Bacteroidia bacterium]
MAIIFKRFIQVTLISCILLSCFSSLAQAETNKWKMQVALGFNKPFNTEQSEGYYSKNINFTTINLGVQHMFNRSFGGKLDFGYNRVSSEDNSPEFKLNYTRVNGQLAYDLSKDLSFLLPQKFATVLHFGPGLSFTKPLGSYSQNKHTFLNGITGLEVHYGISETLSIYSDLSYILALTKKEKYIPAVDGYSFNGNMLTVTVGLSVSLSGCRYCN